MKVRIEDLREHLFAELEDLRDESKPFNAARTRAIVDVSQTIINSAKVENEFLEVVGASQGSGFIPLEPRPAAPLAIEGQSTREGSVSHLPVARRR